MFAVWQPLATRPPELAMHSLRVVAKDWGPTSDSVLLQETAAVWTPPSRLVRPAADGAPAVVGWIRLDNADLLKRDLGLSPQTADHAVVGEAWRRWGPHCPSRLQGDFAFAVIEQHTVFAARDRVGIRPLYLTTTAHGTALATTVAACAAMPGCDTEVDQLWLARDLAGIRRPTPRTAFVGVRRVMPGQSVLVEQGVAARFHTWHHFATDAPLTGWRNEIWLERYQHCLRNAVTRRVPGSGPVGFESSGGLDSSSILAIALTYSIKDATRVHTFTRPGAPTADAAARMLHSQLRLLPDHEHLSQPMPPGERINAVRLLGYPAQHPNALSHEAFYRQAQALGIRSLHSGHGGDDTVSNVGTVAAAQNLRRWRLRSAWRQSPSGVRHALSAARTAMNPPQLPVPMSSPAAIVRRAPVHRDLREQIAEEEPRLPESATYSEIVASTSLRRAALRTEECSIVAAAHGIEYEWPLLDSDLVQQYLLTPSVWMVGNGYGRYLHRRAVSDVLPRSIAWEPRKLNLETPMDAAGTVSEVPPTASAKTLPELHPALEAVVDLPRLRELAASGGPRADRTVHRLTTLTDWLATS